MDINIWSVIVAAVVAFVISAIWYSPILFGKEWMALSGCTDTNVSDAKSKGVVKYYIVQLVMTLLTFVVLAFAINFVGVNTTSDGAIVGILAWLGFIFPTHVGALMWERRPLKLVLINTVSVLLNFVVGGAIIGAW